jgi:protein-L-isoaspartate(D-aspartate) O-methyltransferase
MAEAMRDEEVEARHRAQLVLRMRQNGLRDTRVVRAIEAVPRRLFVPDHLQDHAYADRALPIACGQSISRPYLAAYVTQHLDVGDAHKVLEIGTGTGYQTAVLAALARRVFTIDRFRTLITAAEQRFSALRLNNITAMAGDGITGWPNQAPFDRILVSASSGDIPPALLAQLAVGGVMIVPVGPAHGPQTLIRLEKTAQGTSRTELMTVRLTPLTPGKAASL